VTTHVHKIHAQQQAIISTQVAFEASEKGLRVGTRNIVDTLQTPKNVYAAERDYAHARYDYVIDWLKLKAVTGKLTSADIEQVNGWLADTKS